MDNKRKETSNKKTTAHYVREQKGHSVLLHVFFGWMALYIPTVYFIVSKNHYWHL